MKRPLRLVSEINVTPFVDVVLVLLIIFMITAPFLEEGVEVNLPQATAGPLEAQEAVVVTINRQGELYLGNIRVPRQSFPEVLQKVIAGRVGPVYIKGDAGVAYGQVMEVLSLVREAGVEEVGLVAEARPPSPPTVSP